MSEAAAATNATDTVEGIVSVDGLLPVVATPLVSCAMALFAGFFVFFKARALSLKEESGNPEQEPVVTLSGTKLRRLNKMIREGVLDYMDIQTKWVSFAFSIMAGTLLFVFSLHGKDGLEGPKYAGCFTAGVVLANCGGIGTNVNCRKNLPLRLLLPSLNLRFFSNLAIQTSCFLLALCLLSSRLPGSLYTGGTGWKTCEAVSKGGVSQALQLAVAGSSVSSYIISV